MLFDSHAHINSEKFDNNREELAKWIEESDVDFVMDVGCDFESSVLSVENAAKYDWCYGAVGCHPHEADSMDDETLLMFKGLAKKPKIKAIGEIGLTGDLRSVRNAERMINEASRMGFDRVILPEKNRQLIKKIPEGLTLTGVKNIKEAIKVY